MVAKKENKLFTDLWIKSLPIPDKGQRHDYIDGGKEPGKDAVAGFTLRVSHTKVKSFSFVYRFKGEPRRISLGQYGGYREGEKQEDGTIPLIEITLKDARDRAETYRKQVNSGIDPMAVKQAAEDAKKKENAKTYGVLLTKFLEEHGADVGAKYLRDIKTQLTIPALLERPIAEIERIELIDLVKAKQKKSPSSAVHLKSYFAMFFDWVLDLGHTALKSNPAARMKKYVGKKVEPRERVLEDAELASIWRCSYQIGVFGSVFRCLMLSGSRREEIGSLEWVEVESDRFSIPPGRMKMKRGHVIPISRLIAAEMKNIPRIKDCQYVFTNDGKRAVAGYGHAVKKLRELVEADLGHAVPDWRLHDFRRTLVTRLAAMGVPDLVIKATVGHAAKSGDTTNKVYNQHQYFDERMVVLNRWCDFIESLNAPKLIPAPTVATEAA